MTRCNPSRLQSITSSHRKKSPIHNPTKWSKRRKFRLLTHPATHSGIQYAAYTQSISSLNLSPCNGSGIPMGISSARQNPGQVAKPGKHDNLRPGLALFIEDCIKEILLEISYGPLDNLRRRAYANWTCTTDWDLFFPTLYLLKSTAHLLDDDIHISFVGFTIEDAKALLQLDFQPPPNSCRVSGKWDHSKKALALHLVTKMNQMRNSQGYSSMIIDVHSKNRPIPLFPSTKADEAQAEQLNLDSTT
ncbi:hypothetical protein H4Q26_003798 [Puccinia striiformis f. sp. tritici PST-130]|nr:hypothetical protein H4Q26_003798 [Puccinia striiformis f. sp. tritici PST-130]